MVIEFNYYTLYSYIMGDIRDEEEVEGVNLAR